MYISCISEFKCFNVGVCVNKDIINDIKMYITENKNYIYEN